MNKKSKYDSYDNEPDDDALVVMAFIFAFVSLVCFTILVLYMLMPKLAEAQPIKRYRTQLDYVVIENPYATKAELVRMIRGGIRDINEDGLFKLGIGRRIESGDPFAGKRSADDSTVLYQAQTFFYAYSSYYKDAYKPGRQLVVLDAPITFRGVNYIGGYAWLGGAFTKAVSYCNAMTVSSTGLPRHRHVEQCIRHEFYHLFCATHDDSNANIMHRDALSQYEGERLKGNASKLPLNQRGRNEIIRCIETEAKYYRR